MWALVAKECFLLNVCLHLQQLSCFVISIWAQIICVLTPPGRVFRWLTPILATIFRNCLNPYVVCFCFKFIFSVIKEHVLYNFYSLMVWRLMLNGRCHFVIFSAHLCRPQNTCTIGYRFLVVWVVSQNRCEYSTRSDLIHTCYRWEIINKINRVCSCPLFSCFMF